MWSASMSLYEFRRSLPAANTNTALARFAKVDRDA